MAAIHRSGNERGAALLLALVTAAALTALAAALIALSTTDTLIAGNSRASQESFYALDAGVARAIGELALLPDWSVVLTAPPANQRASFDDGAAMIRGPDGRTFSAASLTAARQAASDADTGPAVFGANAPLWRLYARAPLRSILPPGLIAPPAYVVLWVSDDGEDGDGDGERDSNGQLLLHGDGFGVAGAQRSIEVAIGRAAPGAVRLLTWKDLR